MMSWPGPGEVPTGSHRHPGMYRLGLGKAPSMSWPHPSKVLARSRRVPATSRRVPTLSRLGSAWQSPSRVPTMSQEFKNEKFKLKKWFTKFKNGYHFLKLKKHYNLNIFYCTKHRKIRNTFFRKHLTPKQTEPKWSVNLSLQFILSCVKNKK